jgi:hypothetical protein
MKKRGERESCRKRVEQDRNKNKRERAEERGHGEREREDRKGEIVKGRAAGERRGMKQK